MVIYEASGLKQHLKRWSLIVYINYSNLIIDWLVVWAPLKNMKVNGKDYPIYYGT